MKSILNMLDNRIKHLLEIKQKTEQELNNAPDGFLRISQNPKRIQYFHRTDPKNLTGKYIKKQDINLARALAQKDYNQKVLRAIEQELLAIDKLYASLPKTYAEDIFYTLNNNRQQLISPVLETEEQFIKNWLSTPYQGKFFDETTPELYTAQNERVRSKSEVIIADTLSRASIPYHYEFPLSLGGVGKIYPDFTVLNVRLRKELYWEHLGMMDDPIYAEKAIQKIFTYEQNGFFPGESLILTYETRQIPLNQKQILLFINRYLK